MILGISNNKTSNKYFYMSNNNVPIEVLYYPINGCKDTKKILIMGKFNNIPFFLAGDLINLNSSI